MNLLILAATGVNIIRLVRRAIIIIVIIALLVIAFKDNKKQ